VTLRSEGGKNREEGESMQLVGTADRRYPNSKLKEDEWALSGPRDTSTEGAKHAGGPLSYNRVGGAPICVARQKRRERNRNGPRYLEMLHPKICLNKIDTIRGKQGKDKGKGISRIQMSEAQKRYPKIRKWKNDPSNRVEGVNL